MGDKAPKGKAAPDVIGNDVHAAISLVDFAGHANPFRSKSSGFGNYHMYCSGVNTKFACRVLSRGEWWNKHASPKSSAGEVCDDVMPACKGFWKERGAVVFVNCLAVGLGGFVGATLRYLLSTLLPEATFPYATLAINVVGSFVLAVIAAHALRGSISNEQLSLFLRVGLCGGFTTFSTFSVETMQLAHQGNVAMAGGYAVLTCALCVAAAFAGNMLAGGMAAA